MRVRNRRQEQQERNEASVLVQTFIEADRLRRLALADGATKADANEIVTKALKAAWPKGRTEPWHYDCERCLDTGWHIDHCTPETPCGRPFKLPGQRGDDWTGRGRCTPNHTYAEPCWCHRGAPKRRALLQQPKDPGTALAAVAKTRKPTRFGQ